MKDNSLCRVGPGPQEDAVVDEGLEDAVALGASR